MTGHRSASQVSLTSEKSQCTSAQVTSGFCPAALRRFFLSVLETCCVESWPLPFLPERVATLVRPLSSPALFEILAESPFFRLALFFDPKTAQLQQLERVYPAAGHCPTMAELASCTIYIKGIATTATEADIRDACSQYGNIAEVAIPEGKDFCFVEFAEEAQAQVCKASQTGRFCVTGSEEPKPASSTHVVWRCNACAPAVPARPGHMDRSFLSVAKLGCWFFR